jgi:hypothetical protein
MALCRPYFEALIKDVQAVFAEFDSLLPADVRLTVEKARPMFMHHRILNRWLQRYGKSTANPARLTEDAHRLQYLFIEGPKFSVGLRNKRLGHDCVSYNHVSKRQNELRSTGSFPEWNMDVEHVFLGYRYTDTIEPSLIDVSLSSEYVTPCGQYDVRWRRIAWAAGEGVEPVRPIQPPLIPPAPPKIKPRRRAKEEEGENETKTG